MVPVPPLVPNPAAEGAAAAAVAADPAGNGENNADPAGGDVDVHAIPAAPAAGAAAQPAIAGVAVPGAPARPQPAPLNAVQYLNQLCRDGFTIPTAPGIFLDVVSFFMGLVFSIVPSWAPFRLHR